MFANFTSHPAMQSFPSLSDRQIATDYIESVHSDLCQAINTSLDITCEQRPSQQTINLDNFWMAHMQQAFELRELYHKKWQESSGLNTLHYRIFHQETKAK
ncbi:MAG: hypothetical protein EXX96DRAFT_636076 [Benjaminiella poitrasii]|nr:MAG: hypothetical protein EXX96DRAFT_636076 [Benjaminiella poitrasii]